MAPAPTAVACLFLSVGSAAGIEVDGKFLSRSELAGRAGASSWAMALEASETDAVERLRASLFELWGEPHGLVRQDSKKGPGDMPAKRRQMYFRPVSVTLQCVMALTIASLLVYTGLSISRNCDELSATFVPSTTTQTLTIGSRVANFAPMMCMLFVGCRMYVLATTEGLGEPPAWVKKCMWTSVAGVFAQFVVVVGLPFFSKKAAEEEAAYDMTEGKAAEVAAKKAAAAAKKAAEQAPPSSTPPAAAEVPAAQQLQDATGEQNDVHPALNAVEYKEAHSFMKTPFWILQVVSVLLIYGGVIGVVVGVASFPAQTTKVSAAVKCTISLSCLYFLACFCLWLSRAIPESSIQTAFKNASLAMSSAVRKVPMFAVLFLASRMRALQLDPPNGMPPLWMQCCFYGITGLVCLETIVQAVIGSTGELKKAYYGVYLFKCQASALNYVQHAAALASYALLFPVLIGVFNMPGADGSPAPLSTTLRCVFWFEALFFGVMLLQGLVLFAEEVRDVEMTMLRDTTVAAGISLGLAPLLSILFVATRMRALQITQQQGAPPGWAQDCMLIVVFATGVQSLCCLVMPIFVGSACKVDEDGNPDYDLEPMIGAYAVAVVKYVALMALHGSVITICIAVFTMTPETAHSGDRFITSPKAFFKGLAITMVVFFIALLFSSAKVVGMAIKIAIEAADKKLLGVDITIKKCALNAFKGYVQISRLKVHQPVDEIIYKRTDAGKLEGTPTGQKCKWKNDYIARVDLILIKIDLWRLVTSRGKEFELQNLSIKGIHLNVEKPNTDLKQTNSNVEYIINFLDSLGLIPQSGSKPLKKEEPKKEEPKKEEPEKHETKVDAPADTRRVILHKIVFGDIGAGVCIRGVRYFGEISFHPTIGLLEFGDLQKEVLGGREDLTPGQTVACVIKAVAQKIFTTVATQIPNQLKEASKQAVCAAATGLKQHFSCSRRAAVQAPPKQPMAAQASSASP